jgi:hypothetical protein
MTKLTKAQLRKVYRDWAAEEIEAIELIEAVSKFLGEWGKPVPAPKPFTFADPAAQREHERIRAESRRGK